MNESQERASSRQKENRRTFWRVVFLLIIFGVVTFAALLFQLFYWQVIRHDEMEQMAVDQQTSELTVSASRGTIYDTNGNVLAISSTAYDIILSPKAISELQEDWDENAESLRTKMAAETDAVKLAEYQVKLEFYDRDVVGLVVSGMAEILGDAVDTADLRERCQNTDSQYQRIAQKVDADVEDAVRAFITENDLDNAIYLQPNTKRYYPYGGLAAQIIGFTNDAGGAYGLEAEYEEELSGSTGLVITAQNAQGTDLLNFFSDYYDAQDGDELTLTLDLNIQYLCEKYLEEGVEKYAIQDGGFILALDCDTGAVLGMASSPTFDLNDYATITDSLLLEDIAEAEDTEAATSEARYTMWSNKAVSTSYEPGSTFKTIVLASALEEGVINRNSSYYCSGSIQVADRTIHCSSRSGHGAQTLAEAVGHSCNPAFITIGQALGAEKFYDYLEAFGLMEETGIDLPGEGSSILWDYSSFGITELATASFGQRLQVTPIQLITAINAVVNGGYLYTPHVVESVTDSGGNVTYTADTTPVRQVISGSTSEVCRELLEGVVTSYTGKNAYQAGYRIGGKTGTSETLVEGEYIVSFMGFAPADDPEVIVLVAYMNPEKDGDTMNSTTGYYISGGNMAAPIAGQLLADILDYLGVDKEYTEEELGAIDQTVPSLEGYSEETAAEALSAKGLSYRVVGDGGTVTGQIPAGGTVVPGGSTVILYMGEDVPDNTVAVPDLTGMTPDEAKAALENLGLYCRISGTSSSYDDSTSAYDQSTVAGTEVSLGTTITVYFSTDGETVNDYGTIDDDDTGTEEIRD